MYVTVLALKKFDESLAVMNKILFLILQMWPLRDEEILGEEDVDVASAMTTTESTFDSLSVQQDANSRISVDEASQELNLPVIGKYF